MQPAQLGVPQGGLPCACANSRGRCPGTHAPPGPSSLGDCLLKCDNQLIGVFHALLTLPQLGNNQFTGGLPARWAACPVSTSLLCMLPCRARCPSQATPRCTLRPLAAQNDMFEIAVMANQLTGPAFPPAWVAPSTTLDLHFFEVSDNPGLFGSLPEALNWSKLEVL